MERSSTFLDLKNNESTIVAAVISSAEPEEVAVNPPRIHDNPSSTPYDRREWQLFSALCPTLFMLGWNDGTVGPLLPRMQAFYRV